MVDEEEPKLEDSPLSGDVTRDGITVRVEIYRPAGSGERWSLEVIDQEGASTMWDEQFATDAEAYAEFQRTLESEGVHSFAERPPGRPHSTNKKGARFHVTSFEGLARTRFHWPLLWLAEVLAAVRSFPRWRALALRIRAMPFPVILQRGRVDTARRLKRAVLTAPLVPRSKKILGIAL